MTVRTRIAPSPTGFAHIGTIYQVLFDYVFAKKYGGQFVVRIEDTDRARFVEGAEEVVFNSLEWFGLTPDESPLKGGPYGPYRQSERLDIYKKYVDQLIEQKDAYYCFCTKERLDIMREEQQKKGLPPMYDKLCMNLSSEEVAEKLSSDIVRVVRMKIPEKQKIVVDDAIVGEVEFDSNLIDHQVILKSDGFPTYHLAVVVDDYLMKITHIFRGTEWLPSTPKHILLYQYLGWGDQIPKFIHLPLILNPDGKGKLSKRQQSASVEFYKEEGYLPEAILNYLSNIIWNHPEGKEIYPITELGKAFEVAPFKVNLKSTGARFDLTKLDWMNGEYIRAMSDEELTTRIVGYLKEVDDRTLDAQKVQQLIPLVKERIKKLSDFWPMVSFIFEDVTLTDGIFDDLKIENINLAIEALIEKLEAFSSPWEKEIFEKTFQELASELGLNNRQMFQLLRISVSGSAITPPLFESIQILGESETLIRLRNAKSFLN